MGMDVDRNPLASQVEKEKKQRETLAFLDPDQTVASGPPFSSRPLTVLSRSTKMSLDRHILCGIFAGGATLAPFTNR